jgi:hypothetical protein
VVDEISNILDVSGAAPLALIEMFCADAEVTSTNRSIRNMLFFIGIFKGLNRE